MLLLGRREPNFTMLMTMTMISMERMVLAYMNSLVVCQRASEVVGELLKGSMSRCVFCNMRMATLSMVGGPQTSAAMHDQSSLDSHYKEKFFTAGSKEWMLQAVLAITVIWLQGFLRLACVNLTGKASRSLVIFIRSGAAIGSTSRKAAKR